MATITLTQENFEETVTGDGITLIDFWAEWCGPCKMFGPIFEAASEQFPDVKFAKVDTEAEQGIAGFFQIQSIPTVFVFRDGVPLGVLRRPRGDGLTRGERLAAFFWVESLVRCRPLV